MAYGAAVGDVGMRLLGHRGDIGKPSVLRTVVVREAPRLGPRWPMARATGTVDLVATRGRRDEGVEWGHSTEEAS